MERFNEGKDAKKQRIIEKRCKESLKKKHEMSFFNIQKRKTKEKQKNIHHKIELNVQIKWMKKINK